MAQPDSRDTPERETQQEQGEEYSHTQELRDARHLTHQETGNVPPLPVPGSPATDQPPCAREDIGEAIRRRFITEGRWREVSLVRDRMMKEAKKALPAIEDRRAWVYDELDKMYPPVQVETRTSGVDTKGVTATKPIYIGNSGSDTGAIQGLNELPGDWPELPANASLPAEVAWVQANRLRIVEERPGKATLVKLDSALSPAPSWAALGWLETSIRSYAKFVDVAAKVSGADSDEGAVMKRERKSVDEVKALLDSMLEAEGTCSRCGRPV